MKDEIKAVSAIASFFSFLEKAAVAMFMMFMERSRIKAKKAEDKAANSETEMNIVVGQTKLELEAKDKTDAEVIDDFLDDFDDPASSPSTNADEDTNDGSGKS